MATSDTRRSPIEAGQPAPEFTLPAASGEGSVALADFRGVSPKSFEDAIVQGVDRANKTLKNVKGAWVKDQEVQIDNGRICGYKVILKVTFVLND